jgi:hypothetical protein
MFWALDIRLPGLRDGDHYTYGLRADDSNVVGVRFEGIQRDVCQKGVSS